MLIRRMSTAAGEAELKMQSRYVQMLREAVTVAIQKVRVRRIHGTWQGRSPTSKKRSREKEILTQTKKKRKGDVIDPSEGREVELGGEHRTPSQPMSQSQGDDYSA